MFIITGVDDALLGEFASYIDAVDYLTDKGYKYQYVCKNGDRCWYSGDEGLAYIVSK